MTVSEQSLLRAPEPRKRLAPEQRRAHLLEAAAHIVATDGIESMTMERIADAAGVSRGLLYVYFEKADEVLLALHQEEMRAFADATELAIDPDGDLESRMRAAASVWIERLATRGPLLAQLFAPHAPTSPLAAAEDARNETLRREWRTAIQRHGVDDPDLAGDITEMVLAAFWGLVQRWIQGRSPRRLVDSFVDLVLGGLDRITSEEGRPSTGSRYGRRAPDRCAREPWEMQIDAVRELALSLPGTTEQPHFELIGFRVANKGFIAVEADGSRALVQVDDATAAAFIGEDPSVFGRLTRMGTPIGVEVTLADVDPSRMAALVEASWVYRAPRRLVKERDAEA